MGIVTGLECFNGEKCFVLDNFSTSGNYWQVSRLNHDIWIGNTLADVIDPITVSAEKLFNPIERKAMLSLIQDATRR